MKIVSIISLMRPHQYIKNLFIFLPAFFALKITDTALLLNATIAFVAFSLTASAIYTLNDYYDIAQDQLHPKKKYRPLASGSVSKTEAIIIMVVLLIAGITLMFSLSAHAAAIVGGYVMMNIAYSCYLKHIAILDVTIIALGFVLRLFIGSTVTEVPLSRWIVVMTFSLALFMALAKRRDDVLIYLNTNKNIRKVIDGYNLQFLDTAITIMASVIIVAYTIYTILTEATLKTHNQYIYLTTVFVILGIMRYLQIVLVYKDSSSPTKIVIKDRFMQATIITWIISFVWILYV